MDSEKLRRRQSFKVIISEFIMVMTVIIMVIILAFVVSGYWLNSDFKVERQGMLQVSSIPTGASLSIDGESSWMQRTNTSKILSSGEHTVVVSKDGYDTWTKTVNISEGFLYRLQYPRLFLQNRTAETVLDTKDFNLATVSPARDKMLLMNNTTEWQIVSLKDDKLTPKKIDISRVFSGVSLADGATTGLFLDEILAADWDSDGNHVLFKVSHENATEWVLLDVENVKNSVNLSRDFAATFSAVEILDNSAANLVAIQDGNLRKINVSSRAISSVLVSNVQSFDHFEDEVVFSALSTTSSTAQNSTTDTAESSDQTSAKPYTIGVLNLNNKEITSLTTTASPAKVAISKFYDEKYITVLEDTALELYKKFNFESVKEFALSFVPQHVKVGNDGEFIEFYSGAQFATFDFESLSIREWSLENENFGWLDNNMLYVVNNGELIIYDFDGLNRRVLAKNVSSQFPVTIVSDKWLYYFSDGALIREKIVD